MNRDSNDMLSRRIGPYRILQLLGEGGMASVYLAFDERLGRHVALKKYKTQSIEGRERVFNEAKALAANNHPGVVQLFDVFDWHGQPVLVIEYVDGENLPSKFIRSTFSLQTVLRIALDITSALAEIHYHGIVHCDVSMANILIMHSERAKLTDFGVARFITEIEDGQSSKATIMSLSPE